MNTNLCSNLIKTFVFLFCKECHALPKVYFATKIQGKVYKISNFGDMIVKFRVSYPHNP